MGEKARQGEGEEGGKGQSEVLEALRSRIWREGPGQEPAGGGQSPAGQTHSCPAYGCSSSSLCFAYDSQDGAWGPSPAVKITPNSFWDSLSSGMIIPALSMSMESGEDQVVWSPPERLFLPPSCLADPSPFWPRFRPHRSQEVLPACPSPPSPGLLLFFVLPKFLWLLYPLITLACSY